MKIILFLSCLTAVLFSSCESLVEYEYRIQNDLDIDIEVSIPNYAGVDTITYIVPDSNIWIKAGENILLKNSFDMIGFFDPDENSEELYEEEDTVMKVIINNFNYCQREYWTLINTDSTVEYTLIINADLLNLGNIISEEKAIEISQADAAQAYEDISIYSIQSELIDSTWFIDYLLIDTTLNGGGPYYEISNKTGKIVTKQYRQ